MRVLSLWWSLDFDGNDVQLLIFAWALFFMKNQDYHINEFQWTWFPSICSLTGDKKLSNSMESNDSKKPDFIWTSKICPSYWCSLLHTFQTVCPTMEEENAIVNDLTKHFVIVREVLCLVFFFWRFHWYNDRHLKSDGSQRVASEKLTAKTAQKILEIFQNVKAWYNQENENCLYQKQLLFERRINNIWVVHLTTLSLTKVLHEKTGLLPIIVWQDLKIV